MDIYIWRCCPERGFFLRLTEPKNWCWLPPFYFNVNALSFRNKFHTTQNIPRWWIVKSRWIGKITSEWFTKWWLLRYLETHPILLTDSFMLYCSANVFFKSYPTRSTKYINKYLYLNRYQNFSWPAVSCYTAQQMVL